MVIISNLVGIVKHRKTPLTLLVLAQAYVLFLWMNGWNVLTYPALTGIFAVITAVSLDSVVVSTTFSKHRNAWSMLTAVTAMISGVLIVMDLFYKLDWWWLHASFPILVFMYSQHLSAETALQSGNNGAQFGNKEDLITRLLDIFGEDIPDYKIAKFVGGKTKNTLELIKEIKGNRGNETGINEE